MGAYCASKAAAMRITESAAAELRPLGINVNGVLPTILDTPENRAAMPDADPAHWVALDDLAATIAFLASDDARAVHGALLPVTGLSCPSAPGWPAFAGQPDRKSTRLNSSH